MGLVGALDVYIGDGESLEWWALSLLAGEHRSRRKQLWSGARSGKGSTEVCADPSSLH